MINQLSQLRVGQEISLENINNIMGNHLQENPNAVNIYRDHSVVYLGRAQGEKATVVNIKKTGVYPMFVITSIEED